LIARCSSAPTEMSLTSAIVFGTVSDASGAPVANAHVAIDAFLQSCGAGGAFDSMGVQTTSMGTYRAYITTNVAPRQTCVRATTSLSGTPNVTKEVTVQTRPATATLDSARVDFVVSP
jgi:hypothetical protein